MDQSARRINISRFRTGKIPLLIVTDVASRGIDLPLLDNIINYDFPSNPKTFVNRAGRVARTGRYGMNYSFLNRDDMAFMIDLSLYLSIPLQTVVNNSKSSQFSEYFSSETKFINNHLVYGSFPSIILNAAQERYQNLLDFSKELRHNLHTCVKAYEIYRKTRLSASKESLYRAKSLPVGEVHPLFIIKGQDRDPNCLKLAGETNCLKTKLDSTETIDLIDRKKGKNGPMITNKSNKLNSRKTYINSHKLHKKKSKICKNNEEKWRKKLFGRV